MSHHNNVAVVGMTFVILSQNHKSFLGELKTKCLSLNALLVCRIGGVLNFLQEKRLINDRIHTGVNGRYPNVSPAAGESWETVRVNVMNSLQSLAIPANLKAAQECAVGVQESILMIGFDKVLGAATSTATSAYSYAKTAHKTYDYTMKAADYGKKYVEFYEGLQKVRRPADAFIAAM